MERGWPRATGPQLAMRTRSRSPASAGTAQPSSCSSTSPDSLRRNSGGKRPSARVASSLLGFCDLERLRECVKRRREFLSVGGVHCPAQQDLRIALATVQVLVGNILLAIRGLDLPH